MILNVFSFVFFVIAALPYEPSAPYRVQLIAAGLACFVAQTLFR